MRHAARLIIFGYNAARSPKSARTVKPVKPRGAMFSAAELPGVVPAVVELPDLFEVVSMVKKVAPIAGPSPSCVRHRDS